MSRWILWELTCTSVSYKHQKNMKASTGSKAVVIASEGNQAKIVNIMSDCWSEKEMNALLETYILELIPTLYSQKPFLIRMWHELRAWHIVFRIFNTSNTATPVEHMLSIYQLMTTYSMLIFTLAVLYDIQYPIDDGSCSDYTTMAHCTAPTSVFDHRVPKCKWIVSSDGQSAACSYRTPQTTPLVINLNNAHTNLLPYFVLTSFCNVFFLPLSQLWFAFIRLRYRY